MATFFIKVFLTKKRRRKAQNMFKKSLAIIFTFILVGCSSSLNSLDEQKIQGTCPVTRKVTLKSEK